MEFNIIFFTFSDISKCYKMDDNAEMMYILKKRSDSKKKKEVAKEFSKLKRKIQYEEAKNDSKKWEKEKDINKKAAKRYRDKKKETESAEEKKERLERVKARMKAYRERKKSGAGSSKEQGVYFQNHLKT